ncbi:MAG: thioredoxin family protein [Planctomycetota bacterium]
MERTRHANRFPAAPAPGPPEPARAEKPQPRKDLYDEQADAASDIRAALAEAKKENRRVLIQWGANWCGWCHLLHGTFEKDPQIRRTLLYEYDVVLVDIGRWDKNLDLAAKYEADFKKHGVPYLTILDAEGNVLANQETGSLEKEIDGKNGHDPAKVKEFLEKHQAPYRSAASVLNEALAEAARQDKLVFLHFGAPWCGWCHKLEAWLARKDVAAALAKDFVEVKIDQDRMIGGKELQKQIKANAGGGIPWFAFLDPDGTVVAHSDVPEIGNLGCPHSPEEIDAFRALLRSVRTELTDEDIDRITNSLGPQEAPGNAATVPAETIRQ